MDHLEFCKQICLKFICFLQNNRPAIFSLERVKKRVVWNSHLERKYFFPDAIISYLFHQLRPQDPYE